MQKTVILVESNVQCCQKIKTTIESTFKFKVLAELSEIEHVSKAYQDKHADITLISMNPYNKSEVEYARKFMDNNPEAKTIALSTSGDNQYHKFVRKIGFLGFINKNNLSQDFNSILNILNS